MKYITWYWWNIIHDILKWLWYFTTDVREAMKEMMIKESNGSWTCTECNYNSKYHTTMTNHIDAKHLKALDGYVCTFCEKQCSTKNALKCHMYREHSKQR